MIEPEPKVGLMVHLMHLGTCFAAVITSVDDDGVGLHPFDPPGAPVAHLNDDWHPYNSLHSARPTSGWHWMDEHEE